MANPNTTPQHRDAQREAYPPHKISRHIASDHYYSAQDRPIFPVADVSWPMSPEFQEALDDAIHGRHSGKDDASHLEIPHYEDAGYQVDSYGDDGDRTRKMTTKVAIRDKSPHHFQVIPLRDARNRHSLRPQPAIHAGSKKTVYTLRKTTRTAADIDELASQYQPCNTAESTSTLDASNKLSSIKGETMIEEGVHAERTPWSTRRDTPVAAISQSVDNDRPVYRHGPASVCPTVTNAPRSMRSTVVQHVPDTPVESDHYYLADMHETSPDGLPTSTSVSSTRRARTDSFRSSMVTSLCSEIPSDVRVRSHLLSTLASQGARRSPSQHPQTVHQNSSSGRRQSRGDRRQSLDGTAPTHAALMRKPSHSRGTIPALPTDVSSDTRRTPIPSKFPSLGSLQAVDRKHAQTASVNTTESSTGRCRRRTNTLSDISGEFAFTEGTSPLPARAISVSSHKTEVANAVIEPTTVKRHAIYAQSMHRQRSGRDEDGVNLVQVRDVESSARSSMARSSMARSSQRGSGTTALSDLEKHSSRSSLRSQNRDRGTSSSDLERIGTAMYSASFVSPALTRRTSGLIDGVDSFSRPSSGASFVSESSLPSSRPLSANVRRGKDSRTDRRQVLVPLDPNTTPRIGSSFSSTSQQYLSSTHVSLPVYPSVQSFSSMPSFSYAAPEAPVIATKGPRGHHPIILDLMAQLDSAILDWRSM
ncbi:hypothetical protein PLICRDRAFT_49012 [Plicaturopsis crispa FD-325 SS-3]|nr:hypothetical protein PLICRDRAFT_49012 [Plicaturopsis crispa FD-325 SS-3]